MNYRQNARREDAMGNLESVRSIYEAFRRSDVAAILKRLSPEVEWEYGIQTTQAPWLLPRRGRLAVAGFFEAMGALDVKKFTVTRLLEDGPVVIALIDIEATVRATGESFSEVDEAQIWTFNEKGLVVRFRHRSDTIQHERAFRGS